MKIVRLYLRCNVKEWSMQQTTGKFTIAYHIGIASTLRAELTYRPKGIVIFWYDTAVGYYKKDYG